nr:AAA family ATPase [Helicobacter vulpis]
MEKIEWNEEQKQRFQNLLREFVGLVDDKVQEWKQTGRTPTIPKYALCQSGLNNFLAQWGYVCRVSVGSGYLSDEPAIAFFRQDILGEEFVNLEKPTLQQGFYIWLARYWRNLEKIYLCIGRSVRGDGEEECQKCPAYDILIKPNGARYQESYDDLEAKIEEITNDFLYFANEFKKIPTAYFRPSGTHSQETTPHTEKELPMNDSPKIPLNQILYGPPGTGKTYHTINKALEILLDKQGQELEAEIRKAFEALKLEIPQSSQAGIEREVDDKIRAEKTNRAYAKLLFDYYKDQGRIGFVTFHQSYGYEEFVEGIKPEMNGKKKTSEQVRYKVEDGIFKRMCKGARDLESSHDKDHKTPNQVEQSMAVQESVDSYIDRLFEHFIDFLRKEKEQNGHYGLVKLKGGDTLEITSTEPKTFRFKYPKGKEVKNTASKKTVKDKYKEFYTSHIQHGKVPELEDIGKGTKSYIWAMLNAMMEFEQKHSKIQQSIQTTNTPQAPTQIPYILIIDEINRGNISKIFGELITLIEESKRIGEEEALEVSLPYSKESFGVPKNLYILATMNTADRSIALLDTALRRRFSFVEMMPEPSLLSTDCAGADLQALLEAMNARIEFLLDRGHTIGHAYFLGLDSLKGLQDCFKNKIIPLLQEYFYDDHAKVNAVLNANGMLKDKNMDGTLQRLLGDFIDTDKKIYQITETSAWGVDTFKAIYGGASQKEEQIASSAPATQNANP